jgi:hypothetical protein
MHSYSRPYRSSRVFPQIYGRTPNTPVTNKPRVAEILESAAPRQLIPEGDVFCDRQSVFVGKLCDGSWLGLPDVGYGQTSRDLLVDAHRGEYPGDELPRISSMNCQLLGGSETL